MDRRFEQNNAILTHVTVVLSRQSCRHQWQLSGRLHPEGGLQRFQSVPQDPAGKAVTSFKHNGFAGRGMARHGKSCAPSTWLMNVDLKHWLMPKMTSAWGSLWKRCTPLAKNTMWQSKPIDIYDAKQACLEFCRNCNHQFDWLFVICANIPVLCWSHHLFMIKTCSQTHTQTSSAKTRCMWVWSNALSTMPFAVASEWDLRSLTFPKSDNACLGG